MKKILVSLLVVVVLFACGGGGGGDVTGKWVLSDVNIEAPDDLPEEQKAMMDQILPVFDAMKGNMHYDFKEGDVVSQTTAMMGQEMTKDGKWSVSGGSLTMEVDGASESMDYTVSGDKLTLSKEEGGGSIVMIFDRE